jgi:cytidylate kinase
MAIEENKENDEIPKRKHEDRDRYEELYAILCLDNW